MSTTSTFPPSIATVDVRLGSIRGEWPVERRLHWLLRIAVCCEFVGHGAFGILTKAGWVPYFGVVGISESWAWTLMPVVGTIDITLGTLILLSPRRLPLAYMASWGLFTAVLRPLSGESAWELVERSYNYGIPFLMLWLHGFGRTWAEWTEPIHQVPKLDVRRALLLERGLRWVMAFMLLGHGAYGLLVGKQNLLVHYASVGVEAWGVTLPALRTAVGGFEMGLGVVCLGIRAPWVFVLVFAWKLGSEMLYVPAQAFGAWFEVIERGSSYAAPILWLTLQPLLRQLPTEPNDART